MNKIEDQFTGKMYQNMFFPAVTASLGLAVADMMDALVVGRSMGEVGLAAICMSLPLYMIINVLMHGFGIGGSVLYSKLLGEGRKDEAVESFNKVIRCALVCSLLLAVLVNVFAEGFLGFLGTTIEDGELYKATLEYVRVIALGAPLFFMNYILYYYLRNDSNAKIASVIFLMGNVADVGLNIVFVVILQWGTAGAAWATLIGLLISVCGYIPELRSKNNILRISLAPIKIKFGEMLSIFKTGFATSSQYVYQFLFLLITNHILMKCMGEGGVAIFDLLQNASYLIIYLYDAAAKALQPLASTFYGEKNYVAEKRSCQMAVKYGLIVGMAAILLVVIFAEQICFVFGITDPNIMLESEKALRIYCIGASFAGVSIIFESYFQAVSKETCAYVIALLRGGLIAIPCTLLFGIVMPEIFWYMFPVTEILAIVIFCIWYKNAHHKDDRIDKERIYHATIQSCTENIGVLTAEIEEFCDKYEAKMKQKYFVTMAVEEISLAIIENAFSKQKDGFIEITLIAQEDQEFELHIRDNAVSFNPFILNSEKVGATDGFNEEAMGMMVIKSKCKHFFYRRYQGFNTLVVRI